MALVGNAWPEERVDQICAMLAERKSFRQIAEAMGLSRKAIASRVKRLRNAGDPRLPADRPLAKRVAMPLPTDFADNVHLLSEALEARYGVGRSTIARWRQSIDARIRTQFQAKAIPVEFATVAPSLTMTEARDRFGVSDHLLRRWESVTGVSLRRVRVTGLSAGRLRLNRDSKRDMSRAGMAADYLRRLGPVFRCDRHGKPSDKGTHWARGRYVLTSSEIIDRAERNGWKPDSWRTVATPTTHEGARA